MNRFPPRDSRLIDAMEELPVTPYQGHVWRVVREGRDPCQGSSAGNRWDTGQFEVLYTSLERRGAIAEMYFHLKAGQPVFPSKLRYTLHEIEVSLNGIYDLSDRHLLARLGVDIANFGRLDYLYRKAEYPTCQQVGEAAHFLGSMEANDPSGILVPNARYACSNLVIFCQHTVPDQIEPVKDHGLVDWAELR
ncbi:RES family NAD+ phosphorylase [Mesorhizobium helmanticense]|uniref:RES domain-containing protein n=1 Tax=Mesorhizobium helmanticense TaxID=1776423 RepID=A0A2T4IPD4_9HYPH|nr:RES family NAD+ phosphorylase [Mesorhizobium helmanticense]PTE07507.1 RES domain-containing protein [Mesorhizobium helmanticense]